ncbi:hypothetical protein C5Z26_07560 [Lactobacillus sp. CBA3606]|uniref:hypothetical protein n=1 Tax=Lactobacillus sp. CBA3606 TaxID=2099789 RepID=UPI000CFA8135|nr:hypothetical protein [Lactobacillus sp. CBA3606]AVK63974.1 hypothetical protein C5Z26_07560 [Lactobacillus sp. CBA3606]
MPNTDERYYQPTDLKDAMLAIQKLFNSYTEAPLTPELIAYHQKLITQLQTNLLVVAKEQHNQLRLNQLDQMIAVMQDWLKLRLNGKIFNGKMQHFKFVSKAQPQFKRQVHKIRGNQNHRASRH